MKAQIFGSWRLAFIMMGAVAFAIALARSPSTVAQDASNGNSSATAPVTSNTPPSDAQNAALVQAAPLSTSAAEVVKLAQAGLSEDILLAYVGATKSPFALGSDQIAYLNDLGITSVVIKAMIQRDAAINATAAMLAASNAPPQMADTNPPYPPDDGSAMPPPPWDDSGAPPIMDNSGDYASADDTSYFYDSLAPYGSWFFVSGLGYCWQPTVYAVNHGWQPYSDRGRWLATDAGWYWQSDYSWGWAPFHYGRWFRDKQRGWVWAPNRVWGPAWVSWRQSAEYCGWAPLPPWARFAAGSGLLFQNKAVSPQYEFGLTARQYTFIPIARMIDGTPARYSLPTAQAAEAYQETKVVNDYTVQNNRVVSRGLNPQQVAQAAGEKIRVAEIRDPGVNGARGLPVERIARSNDKLMILPPALPRPDVNYASKLAAVRASASASARQIVTIGNSPVQRSTEPMVLRAAPGTPAAAAEHKSVVVVVPEKHYELYPPPTPTYASEANSVSPNDHLHATPMLYDSQAQSKEPAAYYPRSSVLTPSRSEYRSSEASVPNYYQTPQSRGSEPYRPETSVARSIATPPAYSHAESAPAPVYHSPPPVESHPAPVESHSSPPPESHSSSSSSYSSSSSSSSGHR